MRASGSYVLLSRALAVVEEGAEAAAVEVVQDGQQEALVELEGRRKLRGEEERRGGATSQSLPQEHKSLVFHGAHNR